MTDFNLNPKQLYVQCLQIRLDIGLINLECQFCQIYFGIKKKKSSIKNPKFSQCCHNDKVL